MRILRFIFLLGLLPLVPVALQAQPNDSLNLTLELFQRTRAEVHGGYHELRSDYPAAFFLNQRVDLGLDIRYSVFETHVTIQDGRIWGANAGTTHTQLLEGWLQISNPNPDNFFRYVRFGRQTIQLDDAWLFMARRYGRLGLAHDALHTFWQHNHFTMRLYAMANALNEKNSRLEYYDPHYYKYMLIAHGLYTLAPQNTIGGIVVGDWNQDKAHPRRPFGRFTGGILINFRPTNSVQFKAEVYYQGGNTYSLKHDTAMSVNAFSMHSRLFIHGVVKGAFGLDWISGGTDSDLKAGRLRQFDRLSGTSHSFFGYMDYFTLALPTLHGHGLRDYNAWLYAPKLNNVEMEVSLHAFQMDKQFKELNTFLGLEFDLKGKVDFYRDMRLEFVYGYFYGTKTLVTLQGGQVTHHGHFATLSFQYAPQIRLKVPTRSQP